MNENASNPPPTQGPLLVCLPSLSSEALEQTLANLRSAFPDQTPLLATPDHPAGAQGFALVANDTANIGTGFLPQAVDYLAAGSLAQQHNAACVLLLGSEAQSVSVETLQALAGNITSGAAELALPSFELGPHQGLINFGLLYPLSRALFAQHAHFPLPLDAAFSPRMAARLAAAAQKYTSTGQPNAFLWPIAEAAVLNATVREVPSPHRTIPQPSGDNVNDILNTVIGSLFTEVDARAVFGQRARLTQPKPVDTIPNEGSSLPPDLAAELTPHLENFRHAYNNLRELWSLVLPPNTLLALKKLSSAPLDTFRLPDPLWARTVYDFLLAWRLRTINRGHLLGAFTPLYFAWVASHLARVDGDSALAHRHTEETAAAFENEKPYLVSRWRWPDRFNP